MITRPQIHPAEPLAARARPAHVRALTTVVVTVLVVGFGVALAIAGFPETSETTFAAVAAAVTTIMVFVIQHARRAVSRPRLSSSSTSWCSQLPQADDHLVHVEAGADNELMELEQRHLERHRAVRSESRPPSSASAPPGSVRHAPSAATICRIPSFQSAREGRVGVASPRPRVMQRNHDHVSRRCGSDLARRPDEPHSSASTSTICSPRPPCRRRGRPASGLGGVVVGHPHLEVVIVPDVGRMNPVHTWRTALVAELETRSAAVSEPRFAHPSPSRYSTTAWRAPVARGLAVEGVRVATHARCVPATRCRNLATASHRVLGPASGMGAG